MAHVRGYLKIKCLVRSDSFPNFLNFLLFDNHFLDENRSCFCIIYAIMHFAFMQFYAFMMEAIYIYREVLQHFL